MERAEAGRYRFICFTDAGRELMLRLAKADAWEAPSLSDWVSENFSSGNILVFIGAMGIAVRAVAPFCRDKTKDPAVIVIDEKGTFVIPVLSGHIGGAVEAARELASKIGAVPIITTATDVQGEFAVDVFAKKNDLSISDMKKAKEFSARLLAGREAQFVVTPGRHEEEGFFLIPRCTVVGMGCRKGKSAEELYEFLSQVLEEKRIDIRSVRAIVSADKKKDEEGLIELAKRLDAEFVTYSAEILMQQEGDFESSELVMEVTGADNVCERAVSAYGCDLFLQKKIKKDGMTIAVGMKDVVMEYRQQ